MGSHLLTYAIAVSTLLSSGLATGTEKPTGQPTTAQPTVKNPATAAETAQSDYSVQVGAYQSIRRAKIVRSILGNLAPAEIHALTTDENQKVYRVLVGRFKTSKEAKEFIEQNRFHKFFPDLWVNAVRIDSASRAIASVGADGTSTDDVDPYKLNMNLHCEKNRKVGQYQAQFTPEAGEKRAALEVDVNWACYPDAPVNYRALEQELRPSYAFISPLTAFGTLSGTNASGSFSRFGFGYGARVGLFKNFGPVGPVVEYRLLNQRYSAQGILDFVWKHQVSAGVRLPVAKRLLIEPTMALSSQHFLTGTEYVSKFLPQIGMQGVFTLLEPKPKSMLDVMGGFHYLFPTSSETLSMNQGLKFSAALRARHYSGGYWGGDWYVEYAYQTRDGATLEQAESALTVGVSFLILP